MFRMVRSFMSLGPGRARQAEINSNGVDIESGQDVGVPDPVFAAVAYNELLLAIGAMTVTWRPSRQGDESAGPIVFVATLGSWVWQDAAHAKARVEAKYPELNARECARAAKLMQAQIGKRNLRAFRKARYVNPLDREEQQFWEGHHV